MVEDDLDLEPVFRRVLHAVDPELRLVWARSAREAIQLLQGRPVGFVVADYMLGDALGSQVQRWLERHDPKVPFAMISALPLSAELLRADGTRVPFLPKPFSVDSLDPVPDPSAPYRPLAAPRRPPCPTPTPTPCAPSSRRAWSS